MQSQLMYLLECNTHLDNDVVIQSNLRSYIRLFCAKHANKSISRLRSNCSYHVLQ